MTKRFFHNDTDLLVELIRTNFRLRYNNSALGFMWVLLKPFLTFLVLYIVFSNFSGNKQLTNYPIYLLTGIILFTFTNEGISFGLNSLLDKANIILKVSFSRIIAVISSVVMAVINMLINLIILGVFIAFNPVHTDLIGILYFIFSLIVLSTALFGISFFLSIFIVNLRDLKNITELLMQLIFYGSAIFYPITQIPQRLRWIVELNPLYILINSARTALISGQIVMLDRVLILAALSILLVIVGTIFFNNKVKRIAEKF